MSKSHLRLIVIYALALTASSGRSIELPPLHHPVEIRASDSVHIPEAWTLGDNDELICDTCHGVENLREIPLDEVDSSATDFLRQGPYDSLIEFCYRCHEKQGMERHNVHLMVKRNGDLDRQRCERCHIEAPDPAEHRRREKLEFRLPREKLCLGCHLQAPHLNAQVHSMKVTEEMRRHLRDTEKRLNVMLPLDDQGRVMCATCHTAHEAGVVDRRTPGGVQVQDHAVSEGVKYRASRWSDVFARDKAARLEALRAESGVVVNLPAYQTIDKEILLRLPAKDGTLCGACHRFED